MSAKDGILFLLKIVMIDFLPVNKKDLKNRDIEQLDFVLVTGDAYVDHPSFANALVGRWLEYNGYSVGIIAQPNPKDINSFKILGKPRLGFLISAGNMDSMVNLYTVNKKRRSKDLYSPGGQRGLRAEYATKIYSDRIRKAYPDVPIIAGGIEVSLRRFAHYDYWQDKVLPSILADSDVDILIYGMGERALLDIADALDGGIAVNDIVYVNGTVYKTPVLSRVYDYIKIPSFNETKNNKHKYAEAFVLQSRNNIKPLVQKHENNWIICNPKSEPLNEQELDTVYSLPYLRKPHPMYKNPIPAFEEVKYSITATRGCVGECAFCALSYHQGKNIVSRSKESIIDEAKIFLKDKEFKGIIHDVGGPTANLYGAKCTNPNGTCDKRRCLTPAPCKFFKENQTEYLSVLKALRELEGIKKVFIRSGIRHDVAMMSKNNKFVKQLAKHYVSGQLKLAPEHVSANVLSIMGKPKIDIYKSFCRLFYKESGKCGKKQYILPYFMSSHPGCGMKDAVELAEFLRDEGFTPEQAQDFYPTPGTLATCIYYTGLNPYTLKPVFTEKNPERKAMQRALIGYKDPKNKSKVIKALKEQNRYDLLNKGKKQLV